MITRQRIVTFGIPSAAVATVTVAALLTTGTSPTPTPTAEPQPMQIEPGTAGDVDVVFAVDTTGSMGGLLDGAKRTVWSIATHIRNTDPNANIRIGLVAYRDVGDDYVTKPFGLTTDLDAVYGELATYTADGGNDIPENVDAALHDALKMKWRKNAKKLVFLVGDAPPASRGEVPTFDVLAKQASARGIVINTIRAGWDRETEVAFQQIAQLARGEFSTIHQDGGVQQVATPFDDRMAELSAEIDRGAIILGDEGARTGYARKMAAAAAAPAAAKADRATFYAKGAPGAGRAAEDLVGGVATGAVDLDKVEAGDLPEDLRTKDRAEVKAEVAKRVEARKALETELAQLAKQRDEYLAKNAKKSDGAFDAKVKETVEKQLKK